MLTIFALKNVYTGKRNKLQGQMHFIKMFFLNKWPLQIPTFPIYLKHHLEENSFLYHNCAVFFLNIELG